MQSAATQLPIRLNLSAEGLLACPIVFVKLIDLLNSSNSTSQDLTDVIALDPILTAQVLRSANSIRFGSPRNMGSVEQAVFRLGFKEIGLIATGLKAKAIFKDAQNNWNPFNTALWQHSIRTAALAKLLSARVDHRTADLFFTAGMLHDIGKLVMARSDTEYTADHAGLVLQGSAGIRWESTRYTTHHALIGAQLLRQWNIPNPIVKLVEEHHEDIDEGPSRRAHLHLALANELAHAQPWFKSMNADPNSVPIQRFLLDQAGQTLQSCRELLESADKQIQLFEEV